MTKAKKKDPAEEKNVPAKVENTLPTVADDSGITADDLMEHGEAQDYDMGDIQIPFLRILQKGSPEVDEDHDMYIQGAKPGSIFNTVTKKVFDGKDGVLLIPCHYQKEYSEWKLRADDGTGGGFVANYGKDATKFNAIAPNEKRQRLCNDGMHEVVEAGVFYGLLVNKETGSAEHCVISMTSTQWKAARTLNYAISNAVDTILMSDGTTKTRRMAPYWFVYKIHTWRQSKGQNTWYNYEGDRVSRVKDFMNDPASVLETAKLFRDAVVSGMLDVNPALAGEGSQTSTGSATGDDEEIPF